MDVLLLPGMDGTGRLFTPFERELLPNLHAHVVRYPADEPHSYDQLYSRIPQPVEPFVVVAESFSGPLGIRLAAEHAGRVRALILVATFVRSPSGLLRWMRPFLGSLCRIPVPDFALKLGLLGTDASANDVADLRSSLRSVTPSVLAARLREVSFVDVTKQFGSMTVPVLYLRGNRDRLIDATVMEQMKHLRPDMSTSVLDAPHLLLQRRPVEAARLVNEFLRPHVEATDA